MLEIIGATLDRVASFVSRAVYRPLDRAGGGRVDLREGVNYAGGGTFLYLRRESNPGQSVRDVTIVPELRDKLRFV